jgi:hypothetical protein
MSRNNRTGKVVRAAARAQRLRVAAAAVAGILGVAALLLCGCAFVLLAGSALTAGADPELARRYAAALPGMGLGAAAGLFWLASAFRWWRGRWRSALLAATAGLVALVLAGWLIARFVPPRGAPGGGAPGALDRYDHSDGT